jgi:transcriptional activator protein UGA3
MEMAANAKLSESVCQRCAKIKQSCSLRDGGTPCARCVRLGLPCHLRSHGSHGDSHVRPRVRRVQTGCISCKKRKRKCDESKPKCSSCTRLCLPCVWPEGNHQPASRGRRASHQTQTRGAQLDSQATFGFRSGNSPPDPFHGAQGNPVIEELTPDLLSFDTPYLPLSTPNEDDHDPDLRLSLGARPSMLPELANDQDRALLNHYINITSRTLSRRYNSHSNPYLSNILPIAFTNGIVLHSLLALTAGQWRKAQPQLSSRGLLHQGEATKELASLLPGIDAHSAEIALVSCLLLCMNELYDGTTAGWRHHLQGAKRLFQFLEPVQQVSANSSRSRFFARLYRFLDSAVTVSTCEPPISGQELCPKTADPCATISYDDVAIYGVPKQLFHLLDRINTLAHRRKDRVDEASEAKFRELASRTAADIDHWSLEFGGLSPAIAKTTDGTPDAHDASRAFEWALRLRLHQIVEGYDISDAQVGKALPRILESVQKVRYGSPLESCLLFPLVMAGGVCTSFEDRLLIHDRLTVMERTCGFGQVSNARQLVERVWEHRDASKHTGAIVNWARIRYETMGGLAVF